MAFQKKTWTDRLVEFPGRRLLKIISQSAVEMVVDVFRNEGDISREGDPYSAANMNDLEQRIEDEFTQLNSDIYDLEQISLNIEVICDINSGAAFGGWLGKTDYLEQWNNLLLSKGAKKEIARWTEGAFYHDYQYNGALAYIYGNEVVVNSPVKDGRYFAVIKGIIATQAKSY